MLREGRIGFYNTWAPQIAAFTRDYLTEPGRFLPAPGEPFPDARERIAGSITGLGPAKTAFALGLIYPLEATVCCGGSAKPYVRERATSPRRRGRRSS